MIRQNYFITEQQKALLSKLKEKTGLPVSEIVRRAIDHYVHTVLGPPASAADKIAAKIERSD